MLAKTVLRPVAVAAALMASSMSSPVLSQETHSLSLSLFTPPANAANQTLQTWADKLREKSDGQLNIQFFPSGQMGPPQRQYDLARTGTADMAWFIHGFTPGRFPVTEAAYLPNLFDSSEKGSVAMMEAAPEYLAEEHQGVKILALGYSTPLSIFTIADKTQNPEDLSGKRLRHPGAPIADTIKALNGSPVAVPPPEMGEALSRGIVDGIVTNYEAASALNILSELKYATDPSIGSVTFGLVINQDTYNELPDDLQTMLDDASGVSLSRTIGKAFDKIESKAKASANSVSHLKLTKAQQDAFDAVYEKTIEARLETGTRERAFYDLLRKQAQGQ